jgi:lysophospholipase L1-like esterase
MKKWMLLLLVVLLLCGCGAEAEETNVPPESLVTEPAATATEEPPTTVPPTTVPPTTVVTEPPTEPVPDESWFDDALFIGESRTVGMQSRGRLGNADYFCAESLTVYGVLGITASDANFPEQRLSALLSWKQYGKIYIHLGINELGGDLEKFAAQYQKVIDEIRRLQPDAHIILQSVLALGEGYSTREALSRENIQIMNDRIQALAEENGLLFSDVNPVMTNEEGYLIPDLTFDGCHLYTTGCEKWAQWLLEEAATFQIP